MVGLLALILIGCEVWPKTLAVRRPEQWALRVARPMALVLRFSLPLCRVAQRVNAAHSPGGQPAGRSSRILR